MSHFLSSILNRHADPVQKVLPRLPGNFEPDNRMPANESSFLPVYEERQVTPAAVAEFPGKDFMGKQAMPAETPGVMERPATFLQQNIDPGTPPDQRDLGYTVIQPAQPDPFSEKEEIDSRLFQSRFSEKGAVFPNENEGTGKQSEVQKTLVERIILTETREETRFGGIDSRFIKPQVETGQKEEPHFNMMDFHRAPMETKGALGEPPGKMNGFPVAGMQGLNESKTAPATAPIIKVSIGQIHIRAINPAPTVSARKPPQVQKPLLTLEDYLKGRG